MSAVQNGYFSRTEPLSPPNTHLLCQRPLEKRISEKTQEIHPFSTYPLARLLGTAIALLDATTWSRTIFAPLRSGFKEKKQHKRSPMKKTTPPSSSSSLLRRCIPSDNWRGEERMGAAGDGSTESKALAPNLGRLERENSRIGRESETVEKQQREEDRSEGHRGYLLVERCLRRLCGREEGEGR